MVGVDISGNTSVYSPIRRVDLIGSVFKSIASVEASKYYGLNPRVLAWKLIASHILNISYFSRLVFDENAETLIWDVAYHGVGLGYEIPCFETPATRFQVKQFSSVHLGRIPQIWIGK